MLHGGNLPAFSASRKERVSRLLSSAAVVTAPSRYLLDRMREYRSDIQLIPNAIDLGAYPLSARTAAPSRIVWMRAFHDTYNPELAVRAMARVIAEFPNIHLTMAGPDKGDGSLQRVKALVEEFGLSKNVAIAGSIPKKEVPALLASANIFLNTTRTDNTPVSVIEAMACGLSIVSTNVGGVPYLLDSERNALLVPSEDVAAMAAALSRLLRDAAFSNSLAAQARRDAERFDWKIVTPQWERLFSAATSPMPRARAEATPATRSSETNRPLQSTASEQRA
jgi:glycosyltransferase involved in cell wall biosynthesis